MILPERGLFAGYPNDIKLAELPEALPQPKLVAAYQNSWMFYREYGGPEPIELDLTQYYGAVHLRPEVGVVSLIVRLGEQYDTLVAEVVPLPATIYVGNINNRQDTIARAILIHQQGLWAQVLNLNIDLRCAMKAFEMIIAGEHGKRTFQVAGSRFTKEIIEALQLIQPGELIVFRRIFYRCPGAGENQRAPDMVFEVK